jgi:hypothetical protein
VRHSCARRDDAGRPALPADADAEKNSGDHGQADSGAQPREAGVAGVAGLVASRPSTLRKLFHDERSVPLQRRHYAESIMTSGVYGKSGNNAG